MKFIRASVENPFLNEIHYGTLMKCQNDIQGRTTRQERWSKKVTWIFRDEVRHISIVCATNIKSQDVTFPRSYLLFSRFQKRGCESEEWLIFREDVKFKKRGMIDFQRGSEIPWHWFSKRKWNSVALARECVVLVLPVRAGRVCRACSPSKGGMYVCRACYPSKGGMCVSCLLSQ